MKLESSVFEAQCVGLILVTVALGTILAGAEILSMRKECDEEGLFSWPVSRTSHRFALKKGIATLVDALCDYPQYAYAVGVQVLCAIVLLCHVIPNQTSYLLLAILLIHLLSTFRNRAGTDGADQMQTILLACLACYYATSDPLVKESAVWFISLQASLAYFTAGVAKLFSTAWRRGTVMKMSLTHLALGSETLYKWMPKGKRTNQCMAFLVILFECSFPLVVFTGPRTCLVFLACGFLLHLTIAFALGLPRFLFTFVAAYPAVLLVAKNVESILGSRHVLRWM